MKILSWQNMKEILAKATILRTYVPHKNKYNLERIMKEWGHPG